MENCIFCKIVREEIPCHKIYEDETTIAFLDINPVIEGHVLIMPKKHYENTLETPDEELSKIIINVKKIAKKIKQKLNATGINIVNANGEDAQQSVFHVHYHVIPRYEDDGLDIWFHGKKPDKPDFEKIKKLLNE